MPNRPPIDPRVDIGHVHLKVADIERALAFYRDVLGFELVQRMGPDAAFISAGGYHHHIGLNTWESRGRRSGTPRLHRALPSGDPLPGPGYPGRRLSSPSRCRDPSRRGRGSRRQRSTVSERPGRQRGGALPGSTHGGVATGSRRRAGHVHTPPRPGEPEARGYVGVVPASTVPNGLPSVAWCPPPTPCGWRWNWTCDQEDSDVRKDDDSGGRCDRCSGRRSRASDIE